MVQGQTCCLREQKGKSERDEQPLGIFRGIRYPRKPRAADSAGIAHPDDCKPSKSRLGGEVVVAPHYRIAFQSRSWRLIGGEGEGVRHLRKRRKIISMKGEGGVK
jgi:hypothetical protein